MLGRNKPEKDYESGGIAFVGAAAIGLGIGILTDEILAGLFIGGGLGFLLMAIINASRR